MALAQDNNSPAVSSSSSTASPAIELRRIHKSFGDFVAVSGIDLVIRKGEFFSLLGPSGCGKTTLLRIIAGLDFPTTGEIIIGGNDVASIPACNRPVNTVFQSYALFPHMSVRDNIGFGLKMNKVEKSEASRKIDKIMEVVQISQFADRKPQQLSGGQRQRVALARAVVNEPQVLLLDEPLGALDLKLRKELQLELISLQRRLGITFICVTHDQEEALTMSDRIAVMNKGHIEQMGNAEELYEYPKTRFVGNFLGTCNIIESEIISKEGNSVIVNSKIGKLRAEFRQGTSTPDNGKLNLAIRPEKVSLRSEPCKETENGLEVTVKELLYIGSETHYQVVCNDVCLSAEIMNSKVGSQGFNIGQKAYIYLPPAGLVPLENA